MPSKHWNKWWLLLIIWHSIGLGKGKVHLWLPTIGFDAVTIFGSKTKQIVVIGSVVAWAWGPGRWTGGSGRIFRAGKRLCVTPSWWLHVMIPLSKPVGSTPPRVSPKVNCGLWERMCPCRFISCNTWTALVETSVVGRLCMCEGREPTGNRCSFLPILLWT